MTTVVRSSQVLIRAPLQSVFDYVSDLARHPEWNGGLKIEAVSPGPVAVGKEYVSQGGGRNAKKSSEYCAGHRICLSTYLQLCRPRPGFWESLPCFQLHRAEGWDTGHPYNDGYP